MLLGFLCDPDETPLFLRSRLCVASSHLKATLEQTPDWAKLPRLKRAHVKAVADVSNQVLPAMLDRLDNPDK